MADQSGPSNFTRMPNLIDELDLSPLAVALYFHYARWSGAKSKRPPGVRTLGKKYKASGRAIEKAKQELLDHALIHRERRQPKGQPDLITVRDVWKRNSNYFEMLKGKPVVNEHQLINLVSMNIRPEVNGQHDLMSEGVSRKDRLKNNEKAAVAAADQGGVGSDVPEDQAEVWKSVMANIRKKLNVHIVQSWFEPIRFDGFQGGIIRLTAGSVTVDWVNRYYGELLENSSKEFGVENIEWRVENNNE